MLLPICWCLDLLGQLLDIQIAEEANLQHIKVKVIKSSHVSHTIRGFNFYVAAGYWSQMGWMVCVACCREGDDILCTSPSAHYFNEMVLWIPFHHGKWVSYLLHGTAEDCPGTTYPVMSEVIHDTTMTILML